MSKSEYDRRLHRVVEHIDRHLAEPLDLARLADVAHFSRFHFHRLFAALTGETLGDYLRRRRVEVAAVRMAAQPRLSVLDTALSVGFGSPEAFARAFKLRFGLSPSAWRARQRSRKNSNHDQANSNPGQALSAAGDQHWPLRTQRSHGDPSAVTVRKIDLMACDIAYLRHIGPYGPPIHHFWRDTVAPWLTANGLRDLPRYGITHDDPSITDPATCRYDACVQLPAGVSPPEDCFSTTLPGGRYAVARYQGPVAGISAAWDRLLGDWLPDSGLQLDFRPCFERYPKGPAIDASTGMIECEICIAVAPL